MAQLFPDRPINIYMYKHYLIDSVTDQIRDWVQDPDNHSQVVLQGSQFILTVRNPPGMQSFSDLAEQALAGQLRDYQPLQ